MKTRTGIVLLNLGGPQSLNDVEPFLRKLFSDRSIIQLGPSFLQSSLALLMARLRARHSKSCYAKIGGGSPLISITNAQALALEQFLATVPTTNEFYVTCAMRYCPPTADDALAELERHGVTECIALPLYPHYSKATTGSSLDNLQKALSKRNIAKCTIIESWPTQPHYIQCLVQNIERTLRDCNGEKDGEIVYSAHALPTSFIKEGDPYLDHLQRTIAKIEKCTEKKGHLCFQSRSGPVQWLSPSTDEMIKKMSTEGCTKIVMVPLSFVSDHLETLYEINILYRGMARELGIDLRTTAALNTDPLFIRALGELVLASC